MDEQHWQRHSYLAVLRPEAGWRVDYAVLTTYTADLIACVAALLALAGIEEDEESATKIDFANAYEMMRGRVRIIIQRGRLVSPARRPPILSILDRFIREVDSNETVSSWHPKISLVRFVASDGRCQWRLWLGSRNLTRSASWEAGLVLVGSEGSSGVHISGIAELGMELARMADLSNFDPQRIANELKQARWQVPDGIDVEYIRMLTAVKRPYPPAPQELDELIIISPFLDRETLRYFGKWGDQSTKRTLVSLQSEMATVYNGAAGVLRGWRLLHLASPEPEDMEVTAAGRDDLESRSAAGDEGIAEPATSEPATSWEDGVIEPLGLHAKIVYARHQDHRMLWVGSANATSRGWRGPNVEVVARLTISETVSAGLETFVREIARTVDEDALALLSSEDNVDEDQKRLESARTQVAARWSVIQRRSDSEYLLLATEPPHPDDSEIELGVGLLGGEVAIWPRGDMQVRLYGESVIESELVRLRLRCGDLSVTWLQHASLVPPPNEERDRRALAWYLDPRTFLFWIRSLLDGGGLGDGGGQWHAVGQRQRNRPHGPVWWAPTLEELLKSWSRRPDSLRDVDSKVQQYLSYIRAEGAHETNAEELRLVAEFAATWKTVRQVLVTRANE